MSVLFPEELAALEEEMLAGLAAIEDRLREEIQWISGYIAERINT